MAAALSQQVTTTASALMSMPSSLTPLLSANSTSSSLSSSSSSTPSPLLLLLMTPNDSAVAATASLETLVNDTRHLIHTYLMPLITLVGVLGNAVTCLVLTRRPMRTSSTNSYLTALAVSDLLYLLASCSLSLKHAVPALNRLQHVHYWHYWPYGVWLADAASNTSTWLTVTFTVERYVAVCHPMLGQVYCTVARARRLILFVYLFGFLSVISTPFEWTVERSVSKENNETVLSLGMTDLARNDSYRLLFYWFSATAFVFLPLLLLIVFNSFLIIAVRHSHRQRRHLVAGGSGSAAGAAAAAGGAATPAAPTERASQENRITIMLIVVVIIYLICQLPPACVLVYKTFMAVPEPRSREYLLTRFIGNVCNLLMAINSACNFVLYCAMSDKYRKTVMSVLGGVCQRGQRRDGLGSASFYDRNSQYTHACVDGSQRKPTAAQVRSSTVRCQIEAVSCANTKMGGKKCHTRAKTGHSPPRQCFRLSKMNLTGDTVDETKSTTV